MCLFNQKVMIFILNCTSGNSLFHFECRGYIKTNTLSWFINCNLLRVTTKQILDLSGLLNAKFRGNNDNNYW